MPVSQSAPSHPEQDAPAERNTVLLLVIGGLVAISVVVAALVIFSSSETAAKKPAPPASVHVDQQSLLVGRSTARTRVEIYEDFASPGSRELEMSSRDFLRIEAARGSVRVEYHPFLSAGTEYSRVALQAWAGVLASGTPKQALAFHDLLFDRQPASGSPTPSQLVEWAQSKGIHRNEVFAAMAKPDPAFVAAAGRAARKAGADRPPLVVLDGTPVRASSPTAVADMLQRSVLRADR